MIRKTYLWLFDKMQIQMIFDDKYRREIDRQVIQCKCSITSFISFYQLKSTLYQHYHLKVPTKIQHSPARKTKTAFMLIV